MSNIDKQSSQVQRYANFGVDMMEWDDGGYVKHSDYLALLDGLEAAEKRIADYQELISGLVGVSSSILREVERINKAAAAGKGE